MKVMSPIIHFLNNLKKGQKERKRQREIEKGKKYRQRGGRGRKEGSTAVVQSVACEICPHT
jgi:hypothetical protein